MARFPAGYHIDPFYEMLLTSHPMGVDRFLMTQPSFIWQPGPIVDQAARRTAGTLLSY